ncbi:TPA: SLATT domain-containing protein [Enterobacter kobei]|nr:SLATT domain-containing protein [Enterobacter kobei]MCK7001010.1 SLATT domain-containing protein [Enterobacter kobei]HEP0498588.1 SLATT domain-containing protein [Enterobacter kobei]
MKSTAYARFFSARRYDRLNNHSLFSLSLSSFILIFITLIQKYSNGKIFDANDLELVQLLSSITIATLSIVVAFSSYSIKSEKMRVSGEEINELISKIDHISDLPWNLESINKTKKIRAKYEILKSKSLNHKNFEFIYGKTEKKREESQNNILIDNEIKFSSRLDNYLPFIPYIIISSFSVVLFFYGFLKYIFY